MDLAALSHHIEGKVPDLDNWDPPFCGDIDMHIQSDGRWYFQGTEIKRIEMVKLFAAVMINESGDYFLKTPVEKVRINVDDAPFVIVKYFEKQTDQGLALCFVDNLARTFVLSPAHPLVLQQHSGQTLPYLLLHHGLSAKLNRNVYYQLAQQATEEDGLFMIKSGNHTYRLG